MMILVHQQGHQEILEHFILSSRDKFNGDAFLGDQS